jgi:flagellar assembly protein FliH
MRSRIIEAREAEGADRWDYPPVDPSAADALRGAAQGGAHLLTAAQLDALEGQVKEEARQRGFAEGLAAGEAEVAARLERLRALATAFTHPFQALEGVVEEEIVRLAITLATHLVRREIEHDAALLSAAVHDCIGVLAADVHDVTLFMNAEDALLVQRELEVEAQSRFKIAVDAELKRGDLRIASASSLVDGSLAARCEAILAAAPHGAGPGER